MLENIYHLTSRVEAAAAQRSGEYRPKTFEAEGFIHCSYLNQLQAVANLRFRQRADLVVFEIDPSKLECDLVEENLEGGEELFPHIYGRLEMTAVRRMLSFPCNRQGTFELPEALRSG
jgi:uncharacterized protein (DUF952 family)